MKIEKLIRVGVGALAISVSMYTAAEDGLPLYSPSGRIVGSILSDSGHVYNRDHTLPGDPGFEDNVYEIRVTSASIIRGHVITAWLFCLDADKERIGGIVNSNNQIMGSRLDGNIGAHILENKVHVGYLCGLPSEAETQDAPNNAEDVAYAEIALVDHGLPVKGTYPDAKGEKMEGAMLQLMNRPEEDPFCNGTYLPRRKCKFIGTGIVPLHRHKVRSTTE
ncbi:MAG: hypothetical protein ACQ9MH_26650 [Nitrospinales bacterium]